ncbi:MAG: type II toxin-antitoxin system RelE/ParE family toxin [Geminicoccaceae bacterium]
MTYRVIILPSAESGIAEAVSWIAEHSPVAAARWLEGIRRAIDALGEMPSRCPVARDGFGPDIVVRQLFYGRRRNRYRILFTVQEDTVQILHVRHGARAPIHR